MEQGNLDWDKVYSELELDEGSDYEAVLKVFDGDERPDISRSEIKDEAGLTRSITVNRVEKLLEGDVLYRTRNIGRTPMYALQEYYTEQ